MISRMNQTGKPRLIGPNYLRAFAKHANYPADLPSLWRAYSLSQAILQHFLGTQWVIDFVQTPNPSRDFLLTGSGDHSPSVDCDNHVYRVINLAEMIYNLQRVDGIHACIANLSNGPQIEAAYAELETAKLLYLYSVPFRIIEPVQSTGQTWDFEIQLDSGVWIPADTKSKFEATPIGAKTLRGSLDSARKQLPSDRPSFIFLRVHQEWVPLNEVEPLVEA